jgi:hypothetical protein
MRVTSAFVGVAIGAGVGWVLQRLGGRLATSSVGAMLLGWLLGAITAAVLHLEFPPRQFDVLAVSFGLVEAVVGILLAVALALGVHTAMGWLASWAPTVALNRPLLLGGLGGLLGSLSFGSSWGITHPFG